MSAADAYSLIDALCAIAGPDAVISDPKLLGPRSQDHYFFSPVLSPILDGRAADVIVRPGSLAQLSEIITLAVRRNVPITPRGAGTGNYGQGVPMQGGILLDLTGLKQILECTPGQMRVQAGVKLLDMEKHARTLGAELRYYPSTLMTATAGGFLAGGAGGIGSISWGMMWDAGNVPAATVMTIEARPRTLTLRSAAEMQGVIHNCGLTAIIIDATFALAPAQPWEQHAAVFADLEDALRFAESLARDDGLLKREVCVLEAGLAALFKPLARAGVTQTGMHSVLLELVVDHADLDARVAQHNGRLAWHSPHAKYHATGALMLSDYSWNHTTLWARKADPRWTYLQDQMSSEPGKFLEQLRARKARYGSMLLEHIEFTRFRGTLLPQGMTLVRYESREQLWELMAYCESIGMWVANPHTHRLDEDVRWNGQPILDAKKQWDPHGLLNPGHLAAL